MSMLPGWAKEIGESLRGRILERVEDRESRVAGLAG